MNIFFDTLTLCIVKYIKAELTVTDMCKDRIRNQIEQQAWVCRSKDINFEGTFWKREIIKQKGLGGTTGSGEWDEKDKKIVRQN